MKQITGFCLLALVCFSTACEDEDNSAELEVLATQATIDDQVKRLYRYTDNFEWERMREEVMTDSVFFDMSSAGAGEPGVRSAEQITNGWDTNYQNLGVDEVNHLVGNIIIDFRGNEADVYCLATATLFREAATQGQTFAQTGDYDLRFVRVGDTWLLDEFIYNLRFSEGNPTLE